MSRIRRLPAATRRRQPWRNVHSSALPIGCYPHPRDCEALGHRSANAACRTSNDGHVPTNSCIIVPPGAQLLVSVVCSMYATRPTVLPRARQWVGVESTRSAGRGVFDESSVAASPPRPPAPSPSPSVRPPQRGLHGHAYAPTQLRAARPPRKGAGWRRGERPPARSGWPGLCRRSPDADVGMAADPQRDCSHAVRTLIWALGDLRAERRGWGPDDQPSGYRRRRASIRAAPPASATSSAASSNRA